MTGPATPPSALFGKACYGRSAHGRCETPTRWITTQEAGANPIYACGRHLAWLIALRTAPGSSITVTRMRRPIPCRGYQGIWTLPSDVDAALGVSA